MTGGESVWGSATHGVLHPLAKAVSGHYIV